MNEIYLISSDGHRDSINLNYYATNDKELCDIALLDFNEWNYQPIIESVSVSFNDRDEKIVVINYYDNWDTDREFLETKIYYTFKLNKYEHI